MVKSVLGKAWGKSNCAAHALGMRHVLRSNCTKILTVWPVLCQSPGAADTWKSRRAQTDQEMAQAQERGCSIRDRDTEMVPNGPRILPTHGFTVRPGLAQLHALTHWQRTVWGSAFSPACMLLSCSAVIVCWAAISGTCRYAALMHAPYAKARSCPGSKGQTERAMQFSANCHFAPASL